MTMTISAAQVRARFPHEVLTGSWSARPVQPARERPTVPPNGAFICQTLEQWSGAAEDGVPLPPPGGGMWTFRGTRARQGPFHRGGRGLDLLWAWTVSNRRTRGDPR